ncbi:MAG: cytochrome c biogenesis protein CcsA [Spirochaetales bacterium]|nr:cytochrome c biogenesis protein CcsA [Spirochaetales bacterium]
MTIATAAFITLLAACIVQIVYLLIKRGKPDPFSHFIVLASSLLLITDIIMRSVQINFVAVTNTYESLVFFTGVICLVLFLYRVIWAEKTFQLIIFGGTILSVIFLALTSTPIAPNAIVLPIPALQSAWLVLHVTFAFIGEAFFVVGFFAAILYLVINDEEKKKIIDRVMYLSVIIGYPLYTAGALVFGAIWAQSAWGIFWSWDPKETWALVTWLTYTVFLHFRIIKKWRGKVSAIVCIAGFLFTLFTYFGVNLLPDSLHSYG